MYEQDDALRARALRLVFEDGRHGAMARVADRLHLDRETVKAWVRDEYRRRAAAGSVAGPAAGSVAGSTAGSDADRVRAGG